MITYNNPIIRGFNPDPSICRNGEDFYMTVSSFEYLPGLPIYHSKDLIHWEMIGHALSRPEQMEFSDSLDNAGIFAPTFRWHDGWFYISTTNVSRPGVLAPGGSGNFIIRAKDPRGPWSEPVWVSQNGIDPDIFFDDDGKVYFTSTADVSENGVNRSATQMCEIDIETGEKKTQSRIVHYGCGGRFPEAPHVFKKDGWYYLMQAEGGTDAGHMETIARSKSVWGPYDLCPHNPIITARDENDPSLFAAGHADMVQSPDGNWWAVFLCCRLSEQYFHHLGRETALAPVEWADGWPIVNNHIMPVDKMAVNREPWWKDAGGETFDDAALPQKHTDFSKGLPKEWVSVRTYFKDFEITDEGLKMYGNAFTLSDRKTPAFLGRRQQDFECRMEVCLNFSPSAENEEAGIALMHRMEGHCELVVTLRDGKKVLLLRRRCADMITEQITEISDSQSEDLCLCITADRYEYEFAYKLPGRDYEKIGTARTKMMSSEVLGGCMGTWTGIYTSGNGTACASPVLFKWFEYEILPEKPKRPLFGE